MDPALLIGLGLLAAWYFTHGSTAATLQPAVSGQLPTGTTTTAVEQPSTGVSTGLPSAPVLSGGGVDPVPSQLIGSTGFDLVANANAFADWVDSIPLGRDPRYAPGVINVGGGANSEDEIWDWLQYGNVS